ncbi:MAG: hypothetical protein AAGD32_13500 [Planctomycetota bacterium]
MDTPPAQLDRADLRPGEEHAALLPQRLAGASGLTAFVICLVLGGFAAENPLATVIWRAMMAMFGTIVIGYIVGLSAQWMLRESLREEGAMLHDQLRDAAATDRVDHAIDHDQDDDDIPVVGSD